MRFVARARRDPGSVEVFFSSHPPPQDRIARLQGDIGRAPSGTRDSAQFRAIKTRVLKMPPAKRMPQ